MLMTPKNEERKKRRKKGESGETEEEEKARLLSEDPLDWMMKNEKVAGMLSVSSTPERREKVSRAFAGERHKCFELLWLVMCKKSRQVTSHRLSVSHQASPAHSANSFLSREHNFPKTSRR
jgi:hypothetical protein